MHVFSLSECFATRLVTFAFVGCSLLASPDAMIQASTPAKNIILYTVRCRRLWLGGRVQRPDQPGLHVNAYQPDAGETTLQWAMSAPPVPENGIMPPDDAGFIYYSQAMFYAGFCADKKKAAFMYAWQGPLTAKCFGEPPTQVP